MSLCDKMLGVKRYLCDTDFFSGGNYKFPILLKPNSEIRLNGGVPSVASEQSSNVKFPSSFSAKFLRPFSSKRP